MGDRTRSLRAAFERPVDSSSPAATARAAAAANQSAPPLPMALAKASSVEDLKALLRRAPGPFAASGAAALTSHSHSYSSELSTRPLLPSLNEDAQDSFYSVVDPPSRYLSQRAPSYSDVDLGPQPLRPASKPLQPPPGLGLAEPPGHSYSNPPIPASQSSRGHVMYSTEEEDDDDRFAFANPFHQTASSQRDLLAVPPPQPKSRPQPQRTDKANKPGDRPPLPAANKGVTVAVPSFEVLSTANPHVLQRIAQEGNPFDFVDLETLSLEQLCACMEKLYVSPLASARALGVKPHPTDVIVCGAVRSGQTAVLRALDILRGSLGDDLGHSSGWIENAESLSELESPRLLKTHMTANHVLEAASHACKLVVVMRSPADVRVSWFRHARRIFRKLSYRAHAKQYFDEHFSFAEFSRKPMPKLGDFGGNAEHHVAYALQAQKAKPTSVCFVFFEDLLENPQAVVERLCAFSGWGGKAKIDAAVKRIVNDALNPSQGRHIGSTGSNLVSGSLQPEFTRRWEVAMDLVRTSESYAALRLRLGVGTSGRPGLHRSGSSFAGKLLSKTSSFASLSSTGSFKRTSSDKTAGEAVAGGGGKLGKAGSFSSSSFSSTSALKRGGSFSFLTSARHLSSSTTSIAGTRGKLDPDDSSQSSSGSGDEEDPVDYVSGEVNLVGSLPEEGLVPLKTSGSGVFVVGKARGSSGIPHDIVRPKSEFKKKMLKPRASALR